MAETGVPAQPGPTRNNRMVLLLIGGLPVTMILAATWLWFFVASGDIDLVGILGTANRGTLLEPPLPLQQLELRDHAHDSFTFGQGEDARWRLLLVAPSSCNEECLELLHYTRQIHRAMGKDRNRIERIYLGARREQMEQVYSQVGEQYPLLKFLYTPAAGLSSLLAPTSAAAQLPAYYLVDPQGWVILSYGRDSDGKDVMADLKFLLKNSSG